MDFQLTSKELPEAGIEVIGFNKSWINEDTNPEGTCMCHIGDDKVWTIAMWCGYHDEYHTRYSHEAQEAYGDAQEMLPYIDAPTHWIDKPQMKL